MSALLQQEAKRIGTDALASQLGWRRSELAMTLATVQPHWTGSTTVPSIGRLERVPLRLGPAQAFVARWHRHARPLKYHLFSIGLVERWPTPRAGIDDPLVGVVTVHRPAARALDDGETAEVARLCVLRIRNAGSILLGAAARAAREMGYGRLTSYTLSGESGAVYRACGWTRVADLPARSWNMPSRPRADASSSPRVRWERSLGGRGAA